MTLMGSLQLRVLCDSYLASTEAVSITSSGTQPLCPFPGGRFEAPDVQPQMCSPRCAVFCRLCPAPTKAGSHPWENLPSSLQAQRDFSAGLGQQQLCQNRWVSFTGPGFIYVVSNLLHRFHFLPVMHTGGNLSPKSRIKTTFQVLCR